MTYTFTVTVVKVLYLVTGQTAAGMRFCCLVFYSNTVLDSTVQTFGVSKILLIYLFVKNVIVLFSKAGLI